MSHREIYFARALNPISAFHSRPPSIPYLDFRLFVTHSFFSLAPARLLLYLGCCYPFSPLSLVPSLLAFLPPTPSLDLDLLPTILSSCSWSTVHCTGDFYRFAPFMFIRWNKAPMASFRARHEIEILLSLSLQALSFPSSADLSL